MERKRFCEKIKIPEPTPAQKRSFDLIRETIASDQVMRHPNYDKEFILYVNGSREFGYGVAVYQIDDDSPHPEGSREKERPVMFLSRTLKPAERNYWPMELETGGIVWAVQKLQHIVQSSKCIIHTDHKASETIAKMKGLQTTSPGKKNLRLANWSLFLSQFWHNIDVHYCRGIENVMADALSRIRTQLGEFSEENEMARKIRQKREEFDKEDIHTFNVNENHVSASLVQLDEDFKKELSEAYESDIHFGPIWNVLIKYVEEYEDKPVPEFLGRPRSPYKLMNSKEHPLIFYEDTTDQRLRLCIPYRHLKEVLQLAHDQENHHGIEKTYGRAIAGFFAPHMFRQVKRYAHCPKCAINRTLRHKPHGETQPISTPPVPLHTLGIDFILGLPPSKKFAHGDEEFNAAMTVTDKFSKAVMIVPGKDTYTALDWAIRFWQVVYPAWGLPSGIISDRDLKFLSEFWKCLFEKAGTKLLLSTAYHPQTDGQSERTNQTVEIALRHYVSRHQDDWVEHIELIQAAINVATSATTNRSPFQILYGFNPKHGLDLLVARNSVADDWAAQREMFRKDAEDAIPLAQQEMIKYGDAKQKPMSFVVGDKVFLRLASPSSKSGYVLPATFKPKLAQQRAGPFEITKAVGKNAYKLKLPVTWRIWPVVSVVYLDPTPRGEYPFKRTAPPPPPVIRAADDPEAEWEVEAVVKKRVSKRGRSTKVQYLVRWKGFGPKYDEWKEEEELEGCAELVKEYEFNTGNTTWTPPPTWAVPDAPNENSNGAGETVETA
jgi:RNase H-like domain found in reverse transcriptase/Chromo (CHRromatin Organisation MOdifier) domain/Integrase zinc binding domain